MAIKVLIVDDSLIFREVIAKGISSDPQIQVVGKAVDPFDARDKILQLRPDVITCDIEMPKMDGIEFIRRLMPQYPLPIIVISSVSNRVFDAMEAGAVDFVTKPSIEVADSVQKFIYNIIDKIKSSVGAKVVAKEHVKEKKVLVADNKQYTKHDMIAIGASTGGTEAIFNVLKQLPKDIPGIVIVQHIPPVFSRMFAERLNNQTHFEVKEAEDGDQILSGHVYLAPGDKHMEIIKQGSLYKTKVFTGEKVNGHCPSVDVLFNSVSNVLKERALGVILTGMGYDGARGLGKMKRRGAVTIGQDEKSSVVYGMPKAAYELGAVEKQVSLSQMGQNIVRLLR
ncbi:chemotaxis response regulator protein-glutamate methylesterase [Acidaminobacter sp. JC074]|uniref:protein-glutamate methylesterase/protein-glutamine glutaminase n=1 Tax=Acidaminobacter sp. JC074 TaxID=2530199 RepID=UPI001F0CF4CA|nr:chemotaxis response regulator protein-glutamate methylesterase [Acidaminobacter sp. JC074]MCH4890790.1 chemotaxis response regulator protein-glutamate methylesterase [Acidaminobacter sp. JC074]